MPSQLAAGQPQQGINFTANFDIYLHLYTLYISMKTFRLEFDLFKLNLFTSRWLLPNGNNMFAIQKAGPVTVLSLVAESVTGMEIIYMAGNLLNL